MKFFKRKRDNIIYATIRKQEIYDGVRNSVRVSKKFLRNIKNFNIDKDDVDTYLAYIFSKNVRQIEKINEKMGLALAQKKYGIDVCNEESVEPLKENTDKISSTTEKMNFSRDAMERKYLLKNLSIINEGLLANTSLLETFRDIDNAQIKLIENSNFRKNENPMFYVSSDRIYDCLSERKILPELVYKDLCQQISNYMVDKEKFPSCIDINTALIEPRDLKEFLDTIKGDILITRRSYEKVMRTGNIEKLINGNEKQKLLELLDVFIPGEAGIDDNDTVELIAKNMVWNNRLAKVAGGIHGDVIRSFSFQPRDNVKVAEALDDVYLELMQMEQRKKDDEKVTTLLDDFITDYTGYIEKRTDFASIDKFYSSKMVMKTVEEVFKKENLSTKNVTLEKIYSYLASRSVERELYYGKNVSVDLLIDEVAKRQRMGIKSYKLEISTDPNVSEDKLNVGLTINCRIGRYRVHSLASEVWDTLSKPKNNNLSYYNRSKDLPVNFTTVYKLSTEQQIEILHMLAERTVHQSSDMDYREKRKRNDRINILNFYTNGIMQDIIENGTPREREKIEDITQGKSYYKLLAEERTKKIYGEPKSYTIRKAMLNILYDRVKEERGEYR